MLCRSIASHAWTFVGSGAFTVADRSSIVFEIVANPFVRGERSNEPICEWHAAVFERLFTRLVGRAYRVTETRCCASGEAACRFELQHLK
jgi:divinyl protochlorophyllide a 8-vinyl-reductase